MRCVQKETGSTATKIVNFGFLGQMRLNSHVKLWQSVYIQQEVE